MKLYIENLHACASEQDLYYLFLTFGSITAITVFRDASGKSLGTACVVMKEVVDAKRALTKLNNTNLMNLFLVVYE